MAFSTGGGGGAMGEINVTPMIDILLVLLIIFMVIVPTVPHGLDALVPARCGSDLQDQRDRGCEDGPSGEAHRYLFEPRRAGHVRQGRRQH